MSFGSTRALALSRAGVRVALGQALAVVVAFAVAGYFASLSLNHIAETAMRDRIGGEIASMHEEYAQKGADHLPVTVAKRQRLWRGFDYRLEAPDGAVLAGRLPAAPAGWREIAVPRAGASAERFLARTEVLPNGARLTVAMNLAVEAGQTSAISRTLALCGLLGVVCCVALSYLASRGAWRRVAAIADAAERVRDGDLKVRAMARPRPRDDVDQLALAFNAMLDRIGVLIDQVRQVSTDIAHDMRSPLTRHRQRLERLHGLVASEPRLLGEVQGLEADVEEILRTFDALLQLSEIESDREDQAAAKTEDLAEVVVRVGDAYRPDIEDGGRRLHIEANPAPMLGVEPLLAQAAANLLENAMRHTPPGSTICIRSISANGAAELQVDDDGPGVAAIDREAVLRPFVRLEPSRGRPGSGLGLSIVAAVAARHGAALSLEDAQPGLRVRIRFPSAPA